MVLYIVLGICLLPIAYGLYRALAFFVFPPSHFPKNIPTIPFYYTLIPLFKEVDQQELYRKYLRKPLTEYGAVKIFFGGCWNILVTRPTYIAQVLKEDEVFPKAGNHVKNPHGVLALYTGVNIISSIDETWKHFTSIIKPGLQADVDTSIIIKNTEKLIQLLLRDQEQKGRVVMPGVLQDYTLANLSEALLGASFNTLGNPDAPMTKLQTQIKPKIFNPFFLNFSMLDHFKIPSREEARRLVREFKSELANIVLQGHRDHKHDGMNTNHLGCRLVSAYESGLLSEYHFQQNCVSMFLAGHENPQILLLSTMFMLAENLELQEQVRQEVLSLSPEDRLQPSMLATLPLLTSIIYETLRLFPPISQLMNKRTSQDVLLGGVVPLRKGTYVGYNGYSTNRDQDFWGPDADLFRPSRWGSTMEEISWAFRRATSKAAFISFHGGKRTCIGQKYAMMGARLAMSMLLSRVNWQLDPTWEKRMTPAGPLMPRMLRLQFTVLQLEKDEAFGGNGGVKVSEAA